MTSKALTSARWRLAVALIGTLIFFVGTSRAAVTPASAEVRFVQLLNDARASQGKPALSRDPGLDVVAREWSIEMARTGTFEHRPDLAARIAAVEPQRTAWGENIAWRRAGSDLTDADVVAVHNGLMGSSGHYANIMGNFNRLGVGVYISGSTLWVTFNFLRGPALAAPNPTPAPTTGSTLTSPTAGPTSRPPVGWFRMTRIDRTRTRITGWAVDPDTASPIRVRVHSGRALRTIVASRPRSDVARAFPNLGGRHGFTIVVRAPAGTRVCVDAIDASQARVSRVDCRRARR